MPELNFRIVWNAALDADPFIAWLCDLLQLSFQEAIQAADYLLATREIIEPRQGKH